MWHKTLKISKKSSRIEIEEAYRRLTNDPTVNLHLDKRKEVEFAYKMALQDLEKRTQSPKQSYTRLKVILVIAIIITAVTIINRYDGFNFLKDNITLQKCLERNQFNPSRIDIEEISEELIQKGYTIASTKEVGDTLHLYANREVGDNKFFFILNINKQNNFGNCMLKIDNTSEVEYKTTTATLQRSVSTIAKDYSKVKMYSRIYGANDYFEPFDIINQEVSENNFDDFELIINDNHLNVSSYIDEDFYKELNDKLKNEYDTLIK